MTARAPRPDRRTARSNRPTTWLALGLLVAGLAMVAFMFVANFSPDGARLPNRPDGFAELAVVAGTIFGWLCMVGTGTVLAILRPRNPIGWLLLVGGLSSIASYFGQVYVGSAIVLDWPLPGYATVDWAAPLYETLSSILILVWVPLLFPSGRLPGPRWRPIAWAIGVVTVADILIRLFRDDSQEEWGRLLVNPVAIGGDVGASADALIALTSAGLVLSIILAYGSLLARFMRASGVERQQLKWFLASVGLVFVTAMGLAFTFVLGSEIADTIYFVNQLAVGLPPIAIGIAVLRYRLYDIDRLISRTIGWAIVTVTLVSVFALLVLGLQALLSHVTQGETLAVAASTLVAFALFAPVRRRVQHAVDRRFDRARYDQERVVTAFGERLRDRVDLVGVESDIALTVHEALRPESVALWVREEGRA